MQTFHRLDFLHLNFRPSLFAAVGWVWMPGTKLVVGCTLVDITAIRSQGLSFEVIAAATMSWWPAGRHNRVMPGLMVPTATDPPGPDPYTCWPSGSELVLSWF
jgi:hypothetical protein